MHTPLAVKGKSLDVVARATDLTTRGTYFLGPQAYACEVADGAIILDLRSGTYLGINGDFLPVLRGATGNWPNQGADNQEARYPEDPAADRLIVELVARGVLNTSPSSRRFSARVPAAAITIPRFSAETSHVPVLHVVRFIGAVLTVVLFGGTQSLARLTGWLQTHQRVIRRRPESASEQTMGLLNSFLRLRTFFYTAYRRCLFDSLVLSVFLTQASVPCTLVIGVAVKPFLAHAWVQVDQAVLNDTAEHVQLFTPILTIGEGG